MQVPRGGALLYRLVRPVDDLVIFKGLGNVVRGAEPHCFHGGIYRAEGCHDDDGDLNVLFPHAVQELDAVHTVHAQVRDHEVEGFPPELAHRILAVRSLAHPVSLLLKEDTQAFSHAFFVIDY
jgi:hypothetical protein